MTAGLHVGLELLHLQSHLVQAVALPDGRGGLLEDAVLVVPGVYHEVGGEGGLVSGEAPDPEAVDLPDPGDGEEGVPHLGVAHPGRGGLHDDGQGLPQDGDGGGQDQHAENEGADGVDDDPVRLEIDDKSRQEHS